MNRFLLILLLAAGAYYYRDKFSGSKVPAIVYKDVAGATHTLSGSCKPAVLVFWVTPCPYCDRALNILDRLQGQYPADKLDVVGIYLNRASDDEVADIARKEGHSATMAGAQTTGDTAVIAALDSTFQFRQPGRAIYVVGPRGDIHKVDASDLGSSALGIEQDVKALVKQTAGL